MKIKSFFCDKLSKIKELYKTNKKVFFASISIIVIFIFAACYFLFFAGSKKNTKKKNSQSVTVTNYTDSLEKKIENMLLNIDDIKNVSVLVMVKSSPEIKYLVDEEVTESINSSGTKSSSSSSKVVFDKNSGTNSPIIVSTIYPEISGVLIVTNKIDASTRISIINAISAVLNVDPTCICILQER